VHASKSSPEDSAVLRAVFFDMDGTLGYVEDPPSPVEIADMLGSMGYEISPQAWRAAVHFVGIVDFPRLKFPDEKSFLKRVCHRLGVEIDEGALEELVELLGRRGSYKPYPEAAEALRIAKEELGLRTAVVTTIPRFVFESVVEALSRYLDFVMTGSEAGCDKSNPRMYSRLLEELDLAPTEVVVIGDDEYVDVILPKKLGMRAVQLIREGREASCLADAHASDLVGAVEIVREWARASGAQ